MHKTKDEKLSKFLSLVLRHHPESIGIRLDHHGWAEIDGLLEGMKYVNRPIDLETLERIVREDQKQRYSFSSDHTKIRANQGHSIPVDLGLQPLEPPDVLYHGTASRFMDSIKQQGIMKQGRQYVHLSRDIETARAVGIRHGSPIILKIDTKQMHEDNILFYLSENQVWLSETVPYKYIVDILQ